MLAHAAAGLSPAAVTETGGVFVLPAPALPWLAPACILAGVALQLGALALCRARGTGLTKGAALLCVAGALLVFAGGAADRDITVAVGEALALAGIWFAWRRS